MLLLESIGFEREKSYAPMIFPTNISRKISFFFFLAPFCLAREERRKESSVHDASPGGSRGRHDGDYTAKLQGLRHKGVVLPRSAPGTNELGLARLQRERAVPPSSSTSRRSTTYHKERRAAPKRKAGWSGYGRGGGEVEAEERRVRSRVKTPRSRPTPREDGGHGLPSGGFSSRTSRATPARLARALRRGRQRGDRPELRERAT